MDQITINITEEPQNVSISVVEIPQNVVVNISNVGAPGVGVPPGGTTGQVLAKVNGSDYNTQWIDPPSGAPPIGLGEVAFGHPTTGVVISSPAFAVGDINPNIRRVTIGQTGVNFGQIDLKNYDGTFLRLEGNTITSSGPNLYLRTDFVERAYYTGNSSYTEYVIPHPYGLGAGYIQSQVGIAGNYLISNTALGFHVDSINGPLNLRTYSAHDINVYSETSKLRQQISYGFIRQHSGVVATDYGYRLDNAGLRIGQYSTLGSTNSYMFQVGATYYNETSGRRWWDFDTYGQVGYDGSLYVTLYAAGGIPLFVGKTNQNIIFATTLTELNGAIRINNLAGSGNRAVHVNAAGDIAATEPVLKVISETPAGAVNGINATFTTAFSFVPGTEEVYIEGVKLKKLVDYNTTGATQLDLYVAPLTGETIQVNYFKP